MHEARARRPSLSTRVVSALLPLGGLVAGGVLLEESATPPTRVAAAALVLAMAGLVSAPASGGSALTPASIVAASLPLISHPVAGRLFDVPSWFSAVALGLALLWVAMLVRGDDQRVVVRTLLRRAGAFAAYLGVFAIARGIPGVDDEWAPFLHFVLAAGAGFLAEVLLAAVLPFDARTRRRRYLASLALRDLDVYLALTATGALFGLAFEAIGWWASGVAALPYLFAHGAFRRLEAAKQTYAQTVRALAQIPEVGGHTEPGHAARTAGLAVEVAAGLGLRPSEVEQIELSALMHDIGRVTLNEPNILRQGYTERDLARWGSEIVGETAYLSQVAEVIRRQFEPYRNPGEQRDPDVPVAARIVKVCSAYDEATAEMGFSPLEAVERLHRGSVYDYDPEVVAVLRRVLERRRVFVPVRSREAGRVGDDG